MTVTHRTLVACALLLGLILVLLDAIPVAAHAEFLSSIVVTPESAVVTGAPYSTT